MVQNFKNILAATFLLLQMEFSFGTQEWLPKELLLEKQDGSESYALGLHAPGFFDKVLNVNKCLLQSEPANMVSYLIFFLFCFVLFFFVFLFLFAVILEACMLFLQTLWIGHVIYILNKLTCPYHHI